jgi:hypothetical protein
VKLRNGKVRLAILSLSHDAAWRSIRASRLSSRMGAAGTGAYGPVDGRPTVGGSEIKAPISTHP